MNVHAAADEKDDVDKDWFYQISERTYDAIPNNDVKMVMGNLNAKLLWEFIYKVVVGKHSLHLETNNNGQKVIDFAISKNIIIT